MGTELLMRVSRVSSRKNAMLRIAESLRLHSTHSQRKPEFCKEEITHFGFERVKTREKARKVHDVFETVSSNYDIMNDAMSFGIHRLWKDIFVQRLGPTANMSLLDVAGGTGDIAHRYLKHLNFHKKNHDVIMDASITVCDINEAMLNTGKLKAEKEGWVCRDKISWIHGDAEQLPVSDSTYSAYTIAFGIRNVTHIDKVLKEAYRVLEPGGRFLCLEFSHIHNPYLQWLYDKYSFQIIPVMGQLISGQWKPYQYLVESIRQFPNQEDFRHLIEAAGFKFVTYEDLTFGVVSIHSGFKI